MKLVKMLAAVMVACGLTAGAIADVKVSALGKGIKTGVAKAGEQRVAGYKIATVPVELESLVTVYAPRGDGKKPGASFSFVIDQPADVYLLVHDRGTAKLPEGWTKTKLKSTWLVGKGKYTDSVYKKSFPAGKVEVPAHDGTDGSNYGVPNTAVVKAKK